MANILDSLYLPHTYDHGSVDISCLDGGTLPGLRINFYGPQDRGDGTQSEPQFVLAIYGKHAWTYIHMTPVQTDEFVGQINNAYLAALDDLAAERDRDGVPQ